MADGDTVNGWLQLASTVGPVAGVVVGALLTRGLSRHTFTRDFAMRTIEQRRLTYTAFRKALWAYGGRTYFLLNLMRETAERRQRPLPAMPPPKVVYDHDVTRARQEACRDAFADLVLWASPEVSQAGWQAYEALSQAVKAALPPVVDLSAAEAAYREYERHHVTLSNAINSDVRDMNLVIFERTTPAWKRFSRRVLRRPHPFDVVPTPSEPPTMEGIRQPDEAGQTVATILVADDQPAPQQPQP